MMWKHRTQTGRVVYDRPPHRWKFRDIHRVTITWASTETLDGIIQGTKTIVLDMAEGLAKPADLTRSLQLLAVLIREIHVWLTFQWAEITRQSLPILYKPLRDFWQWVQHTMRLESGMRVSKEETDEEV